MTAQYEIHLTTAPISSADWPAFAQYAAGIGARPMVIELARGQHPVQPMLTLERAGPRDEVIEFARVLAQDCARSGYRVVRCKIEQEACAGDVGERRTHHYFEWHGRVVVAEETRVQLASLCQSFGAHLSNNAIRGGDIRYVTTREPADYANLSARVAALAQAMHAQGWEINKQQWERVVHDTNLALDLGWLETLNDD